MKLKKGKARPALAGHPWVFSGALQSREQVLPGTLVSLQNEEGEVIGYGHAGGDGPIALRVLSLGTTPPDEKKLIQTRIRQAIARRQLLSLPNNQTNVYRLIAGEGDRLPGVIVDRMGDGLSIQLGTAGMLRLEELILSTLKESLSPDWMVVEVPDAATRLEGLPARSEMVLGDEESLREVVVQEWGIQFHIDPLGGQKTGYYADQRNNRRRVSEFAEGRSVLDAYCYGAAYGLAAKILGNAKEVVSVDSSPRATRMAKRNASLNNTEIEVITADVMSTLRKTEERQWGMVIIDPPKFVKSRSHLKEGLKKYRKLNELALRALSPDGILVTHSCSGMVSEHDFIRMLTDASYAADKHLHILEVRGQAPDHPYLAACPESHYLTCVIASTSPR